MIFGVDQPRGTRNSGSLPGPVGKGVEFRRNNNADIFAERPVYIGPKISVKPERYFFYVSFSLRHDIVLAPWSI